MNTLRKLFLAVSRHLFLADVAIAFAIQASPAFLGYTQNSLSTQFSQPFWRFSWWR